MKQVVNLLDTFLHQLKEIENKFTEIRDVLTRITNEVDQKTSIDFGMLSRKEKGILKLISEDRSTPEIAKLLNLSRRTIETHRYNIQQKFKLASQKDIERILVPEFKKQFRD